MTTTCWFSKLPMKSVSKLISRFCLHKPHMHRNASTNITSWPHLRGNFATSAASRQTDRRTQDSCTDASANTHTNQHTDRQTLVRACTLNKNRFFFSRSNQWQRWRANKRRAINSIFKSFRMLTRATITAHTHTFSTPPPPPQPHKMLYVRARLCVRVVIPNTYCARARLLL